MKLKTKLVSVLIMNVFTCATLCTTAQLLAIAHGSVDHFAFSRFLLNYCVAFPIACLAGMLLPAVEFGQWVCKKFGVTPGILYTIVMSGATNLIYTVILSTAMTFLNVIVLARLGFVPFFFSLVRDFVPMWLASSVVSGFITKPIMKLSHRLTGEELPPML